ncbi:MAG: CbtB domain-containing protein [Gammaproteobacteria bacterium]|jgi:cobalt transporter subunit CbtB|nr:CbtB domain-containing protein [Gammaproteobacteria bacterium]HJP35415.1 CbtB domain-containing protein [Gammaproteobacteria bacterium]
MRNFLRREIALSNDLFDRLPWSTVAGVTSALLLGIFILAGTLFADISAVHNAAHDVRHSMNAPCH